MNGSTAIVSFGLDLRLADNPALQQALTEHSAVIPVFIWAPEEESPWAPGAASRWWLHQSLKALEASLVRHGSKLILRRGPSAETLLALAAETGANSVFWNRRYEPALIERDRLLQNRLREAGLTAESCGGNVLFEPGTILNAAGKPFQVFTPFWRACRSAPVSPKPEGVPAKLSSPIVWAGSLEIADLGLEPDIDWAGGLRESWTPGEVSAAKHLKAFFDAGISGYATDRERPDHRGTSRISPHLHFGEISARQIWNAVKDQGASETYLRQIAWREFSYHLLFHFPYTAQEPLRQEFRYFPWRVDGPGLLAWTRGKTGYPLVDAGMRELWHTGWMHNRVRMLAASFLVKHLMIPWQEGAAWFWDTLVDADLANNTMGWQWTAGCGADAAPYFRIFNPVIQGKKFDPQGEYVQRWVPELGSEGYPKPIVNHEAARKRALATFSSMKASHV